MCFRLVLHGVYTVGRQREHLAATSLLWHNAHVPAVVRARRRGSGAHPSGGGCAMAVSSDCLKGTLWLTKEGSFSST